MARHSFGPFMFDHDSAALSREGKPISIGGRGAALLGALLDAEDAVVGKEALIEAAWPGMIVEDGNLAVQMTGLRTALGHRPDGTEWIATVPRVGYRLARAAAPQHPETKMTALMVLPFENLSSDPEQGYFAHGTHLGRMEEAVRWRKALQALQPDATLKRLREGQRMRDPYRMDMLIEGMRLAEMPDE